ncbi:hypothetical protein [Kitasatospora sp. NPDC004272]
MATTPTDPTWLPTISYDEGELRKLDSAMAMADGTSVGSRAGVRPGDPGLLVTLSAGTINVSAGTAIVTRAGQGVYRVQIPAGSPGTLAAANATFSRIDLVYVRVWDTSVDSSGLRRADLVYLAGTASATPVAPSPGATEIYLPLATITVPSTGGGGTGSATVSTAVRPYTVAPGGILPTTSTAEPSSGGPGQVFYDADTDSFRYFKANGTTKASLLDSLGGSQIGKIAYARKNANQQVINSSSPGNDSDLFLPVLANSVYIVHAVLFLLGDTSGDFRVKFAAPTGATFSWSAIGQPTTASSNAGSVNTIRQQVGDQADFGTVTGTVATVAVIDGLLRVSSTAGNLQMQWSQATANANPTTLLTDSYMSMERVA